MNSLVDYVNFVGAGLYFFATVMFFYLFIRTTRTKDGIGLFFLKILTLGLSLGSFTIFSVRILSEYANLSFLNARAIAIVNPILLICIGAYLNYLFHHPSSKIGIDSKNIKEIKKDVKEVKADVEVVKKKIVK